MSNFYTAITCDSPPVITDGSTDCVASIAFDDICTASCHIGFHLSGTETLTCQDSNDDGTGDFSTAPTCTGMLTLRNASNIEGPISPLFCDHVAN